jgi:Flp pilus assembly CpaE family ATPase
MKMKKVLTALGNPTLNNELKKYEKYDVLYDDLIYQEAVTDVLDKTGTDILVLSGLLQGQYDMVEFINLIKKKNRTLRIILIIDEITDETRNILISKGVFDIFCDSEIDVTDIVEAIDREEPINKRIEAVKEVIREKYNTQKETIYISKTQKQEIITVCGTNGSGKSTVLRNICRNLSKRSNSKILVIDLDTLNGNIDEIFGIDKVPQGIDVLIDEDKKCGLNYAVDLISKNRFDSNILEEIIIKSRKNRCNYR